MTLIWSEKPNACIINQNIDSETYVLGSPVNTSVALFYISGNEFVKYLPRHTGEKFPNLTEIFVEKCGLRVVRSHYFEKMQNLEELSLATNKIKTIDADAFKDLVKVEYLYLGSNLIETLDAKLFVTMVELKKVDLNDNRINILGPTTFLIPGGKLEEVDLSWNVCVHNYYDSSNWNQLEPDLKTNCTSISHVESTKIRMELNVGKRSARIS